MIEVNEVTEVKKSSNDSIIKKFNKDLIIYIPAIILPAILNVISIMLYTRIFSLSDFGNYSIIISTITLFTTVLSQWIIQSIQKFRPQYKKENKIILFDKYLIFTIQVLVFSIITILLILYVVSRLLLEFEIDSIFIISGFILILQILFVIGSTIFQSDLRANKYKKYQLINSVMKFIFSIVFILLISKTIGLVFVGMLISLVITNFFLYKELNLTYINKNLFKNKNYRNFLASFVNYGFPMIGWFLGSSILTLSDRYLIGIFKGAEEVGIYSANSQLVMVGLGLVCSPILSAAHPIIMNATNNKEDVEIENVIKKFSRLYLLLLSPIVLYVILTKEIITNLFLGEPFREGSIIIPIILIGIFFWNFTMYGHKGHEIKGKTKVMLFFVLLSGTVNILLNLVLIPKYGFIGAAIATLIAYLTYPVFIFISSRKIIKWNIPCKSTCNIMLAILLTYLVYEKFKNSFLIENSGVYIDISNLIISFIIIGAIYLILLIVLKELKIPISFKWVKK
ncbi:lipopolysaccharide biosynthesis protein [Fictibacillus barbaricus]|uniref:Oligosaccharide flippase family protein n=1 Tax=Fictibacillus barbaricus TaxID=182136 RepID=A0ABS2ZF11_9BACL|nr:oligosaccharide flippase family protein [Fictibacillus barbaricus]MBN3546525.1 oligosaccharide flippase family protein [Fictibacillus barbaricus]GGB41705.1 hypothetical protein GCM10007199_03730 [Fictibacillus barbaricus]